MMAGPRKDGNITRRGFVRLAVASGLGAALASCGSDPSAPTSQPRQGVTPEQATATPLEEATATPLGQATAVPASPTESFAASPEALAEATTAAPTTVREETAAPSPTPRRPTPSPTPEQAYLSVARGSGPEAITLAALAAIGGIERFVKSGDDVIVKPNICVDYRTYEYGATTNPEVVATLVKVCLAAGARRVRVMDSPFGGAAKSAYARSGIADAVKAAGGEMELMNQAKFVETTIPEGQDISKWDIYQEVLAADVLINVPIAKHHSLARLTLGGKNLMGVILNRGMIHANLGQRIADITSVVRPTLTVVDAVRTLMKHGPTGGKLDDVRLTNTVIASHDIVAADAYAATLFGLAGKDISYVKASANMGLGTLDLDSIKIEEIAVG